MSRTGIVLITALLVALFGGAIAVMGAAFFKSGWPVFAFSVLAGAAVWSAHRSRSKHSAQTLADASLGQSLIAQHHASVCGGTTGDGDGD
jgi:membrane protein implicated in regulation of membrane protease activity